MSSIETSVKPTPFQRLIKTIELNNQQLAFGSYGAELSFYIIWSIIPLLLALANVIAVLPISQTDIINTLRVALPDEVETTILPILEYYLNTTSTGVFSISLIISLWPASNIFNALQRILNTIYKAKTRQNAMFARAFAYLFMILLVALGVGSAFIMVFGDTIVNFLLDTFNIRLGLLEFLVQQGGLIAFVVIFLVMLVIYHFVPNVDWNIKYSVPGAIFAVIGFTLISQVFNIYLALAGSNLGGHTLGVFIVLIIWLYFNAIVITLGAYLNVIYYDYDSKSYWQLLEATQSYQTFHRCSAEYVQRPSTLPALRHKIYYQQETYEHSATNLDD